MDPKQPASLTAPKPSEVKRKSVGDLASMFEKQGIALMGVPPPRPQPIQIKPPQSAANQDASTQPQETAKSQTESPSKPKPTLSVNQTAPKQTQQPTQQPTQQAEPKSPSIKERQNLLMQKQPDIGLQIKAPEEPRRSPGRINNNLLTQMNNQLPIMGMNPMAKRGSAMLPQAPNLEQFVSSQKFQPDVDPMLDRPTYKHRQNRNSMNVSLDLEEQTTKTGIFRSQHPVLKSAQSEIFGQRESIQQESPAQQPYVGILGEMRESVDLEKIQQNADTENNVNQTPAGEINTVEADNNQKVTPLPQGQASQPIEKDVSKVQSQQQQQPQQLQQQQPQAVTSVEKETGISPEEPIGEISMDQIIGASSKQSQK